MIAAVVYDDNVFAQPVAVGDFFLRVSPSLTATKVTTKHSFVASYGFDAERYDTYDTLNSARARQSAQVALAFRPTLRRAFGITGAYLDTNNPTELNTLTTLTVGRRRANRWELGSTFHQNLSRTMLLDLAFLGSRDRYAPTQTDTATFDARLGRKRGQHSEYFVHGNARRYDFGDFGGVTLSNGVAGGWAWSGKSSRFTADGGVSNTAGEMGGTAAIGFGRFFGQNELTGRYERGTTTTIGVPQAIWVDHVDFTFAHQSRLKTSSGQPRGFRLTGRGGVSRSQYHPGETWAYNWTIEVTRPVSKYFSLVAVYDGTTQDALSGVVVPLSGSVQRNRVWASIQFSPWSAR